jgi:general stress protein YciG
MLDDYNPNKNDNDTDEDMEAEEFDDIGSKGGQSSSDDMEENDTSSDKNDARGFASMDPTKQREIASKGGKAAHRKGTAHEWDAEEAREAGRKGGQS